MVCVVVQKDLISFFHFQPSAQSVGSFEQQRRRPLDFFLLSSSPVKIYNFFFLSFFMLHERGQTSCQQSPLVTPGLACRCPPPSLPPHHHILTGTFMSCRCLGGLRGELRWSAGGAGEGASSSASFSRYIRAAGRRAWRTRDSLLMADGE